MCILDEYSDRLVSVYVAFSSIDYTFEYIFCIHRKMRMLRSANMMIFTLIT